MAPTESRGLDRLPETLLHDLFPRNGQQTRRGKLGVRNKSCNVLHLYFCLFRLSPFPESPAVLHLPG